MELDTQNENLQKVIYKRRNFSFRLITTHKCTHQCDYCHVFTEDQMSTCGDKDFMDFETAKQVIDTYYAMMKEDPQSTVSIGLYGGETLLNWKLVKQALEYGNALLKNRVNWILNTNGALITKERAEFLKKNRVDVHISSDGPRPENNQYRKFLNGRPTHDRLIHALEILKDCHYKLQFDSCMTDSNINDLPGLIDQAAKYNVDRIYLAVTDQLPDTNGRQKFVLDPSEVADKIVEGMAYGKSKGVGLYGPWYTALFSGRSNGGKKASKSIHMNFETDGNFFFPPYMTKPIGHVSEFPQRAFTGDHEKMTTEWDQLCDETCRNCGLRSSCQSYLMNMVSYHTGSLDSREKECDLIRNILNRLPKLWGNEQPNLADGVKLKVSRHLHVIPARGQHHPAQLGNYMTKSYIYDYDNSLGKLLMEFDQPTSANELFEKNPTATFWVDMASLLKAEILVPENVDEGRVYLKRTHDLTKFGPQEYENFEIYSEVPFEKVDKHLRSLNRAYERILKAGLPAPKEKPILYFTKDWAGQKRFWGTHEMPGWMSGFVTNRTMLVINTGDTLVPRKRDASKDQATRAKEYTDSMTHELMHIFIGRMTSHIPSWFEEGLCEFMGKPYSREDFKALAKEKKIFSVRELGLFVTSNLLDLDDSPVAENICYKTVHSLVHELVEEYGFEKIIAFVKDLSPVSQFAERFEKHFQISVEDFHTKWLATITDTPEAIFKKMEPSPDLQTISRNGKTFFWNSKTGNNFVASDALMELIQAFEGGKSVSEVLSMYKIPNVDGILTQLWKNNLLRYQRPEGDKKFQPFKVPENGTMLRSLRMVVTEACNMACSYCYIINEEYSKKLMSWDVAKKSVDEFAAKLRLAKKKGGNIRFFGGEPMLNYKIVKKTLEYLKSDFPDLQFTVFMNTNGVLFDHEKAQVMAEHNVNVIISLDGPEQIHNKTRLLKNKKESFEIIDKNIDLLVQAGCSVSFDTTVGDDNLDHLKGLLDYLAQKNKTLNAQMPIGFQSMQMGYQEDQDTDPIDTKVKKMIEVYRHGRDIGVMVSGLMSFPFGKINDPTRRGRYCSAAGGEMSVSADGGIYPCAAIKTKMGELDDVDAIFKTQYYHDLASRTVGHMEKCKGCEVEAYCAGGCIADAMAAGGEVLDPSTTCEFEKKFFKAQVEEFLLG